MPYVVSRVVSSQDRISYGSAYADRHADQASAPSASGTTRRGRWPMRSLRASMATLLTLSAGTNDTVVRQGEPAPVLHSHDGQGR